MWAEWEQELRYKSRLYLMSGVNGLERIAVQIWAEVWRYCVGREENLCAIKWWREATRVSTAPKTSCMFVAAPLAGSRSSWWLRTMPLFCTVVTAGLDRSSVSHLVDSTHTPSDSYILVVSQCDHAGQPSRAKPLNLFYCVGAFDENWGAAFDCWFPGSSIESCFIELVWCGSWFSPACFG